MYTVYVIFVALTAEVQAGWASMSLQMSGMFLLISLVLSMMCEFLIFMKDNLVRIPSYTVREEPSLRQAGLFLELNVASDESEKSDS
jgi:hypothetical protein